MMVKKKRDLKIISAEFELNEIMKTYCDVPKGDLFAYIGSSGYLEIGINGGNASLIFSKISKITLKYY
ncbi:hypothetical protein MASR1M45_31500 [Candidatus Kapaibacterium sp.]